MRNRFPPPTSLKKLEEILQDEWYKIPLETAKNIRYINKIIVITIWW
jgi:hypothetical protein